MGHEDVLKLTDLKDIFEDEDGGDVEGEVSEDVDCENEHNDVAIPQLVEKEKKKVKDSDSDEPEQEEEHKSKKRKKQTKDPLAKKRGKKGRNQVVADPSFFSGL